MDRAEAISDAYADGQAEGESWERQRVVAYLLREGLLAPATAIAEGAHVDGDDRG